MYIPIFLIAFVSFTLALQVILKKSDNSFENKKAKFNELEEQANETIIKDGDKKFPYIKVNTSNLPIRSYEQDSRLKRKQDTAVRKSSLTMIRFDTKKTNTELKLEYGANNFDKAMLYEEHFNGYVRALYDWSCELNKNGNEDDALKVAEAAAELKSDSSKVYILLAKLYYEKKDIHKLNKLYSFITEIDLYRKQNILEDIKQKISEMEE